MFVRVKSTPNSPRRSVQIVENIRSGTKIKQKIVRYVGIAMDEREEQKLKDLANEYIIKLTKEREQLSGQLPLLELNEDELLKDSNNKRNKKAGRPPRKNINDIIPPEQVALDLVVEKARIVEGIHEIAGATYKDIGYQELLTSNRDKKMLCDLVMARLVAPASKHKTKDILLKRFDKEYDLDAIYRLMDKVYGNIDDIKAITFMKTKNLFPQGVDLVLFDVTTLYFESTTTDELRRFGYSKDHRFNTTQLVLALATNSDGLPVGYELFEGNKAEVTTLMEAIDRWKALFNIGSVCFVGDRAMFSKNNLKLISERGYQYIIAAKLRSLNDELKSEILLEKNYKISVSGDQLSWIGEFEYEKQRLIVNYKTKRAAKDKKDRERTLEKIKKTIGGEKGATKKAITNNGIKKYTSTDDSSKVVIDEVKIAQDSDWDGMHGIITNISDEAAGVLIGRYSRLWVIEESFRINKHNLKMRPIFHWKPERIKAHIAICYMAFSVLRYLQYQVTLTQKISIDTILDELLHVQSSILIHKVTKDLYRLPGHMSREASKIYKAMNIERSLDAAIYLP